jgi:hypothetical protein
VRGAVVVVVVVVVVEDKEEEEEEEEDGEERTRAVDDEEDEDDDEEGDKEEEAEVGERREAETFREETVDCLNGGEFSFLSVRGEDDTDKGGDDKKFGGFLGDKSVTDSSANTWM